MKIAIQFEGMETPGSDKANGYRYEYLVECRNEVDFCQIVGSTPTHLDFPIFDGAGALYRPEELEPDAIIL